MTEQECQQLFDRYYCPFLYFFGNQGFSREDCRELVQDTFVEIVKSWSSYRGESPLKSWLFGIARNVSQEAFRRRSRQKRAVEEVSLDKLVEEGVPIQTDKALGASGRASEPLSQSLRKERRRILHQAIDDLPPMLRDCMILRVERDLKYQQIAVLLGVSIETVKGRLHQAKKKLQQRLDEHFDIDS